MLAILKICSLRYNYSMIREQFKKAIKDAVLNLSFKADDINLEHPADLEYGDYSTNIALVLAKKEKKNPKELAGEIVRYIERNKPESVERIEAAGAGFINFYLSQEFFIESIKEILKAGDDWGKGKLLKSKKVMVEYTDPNPFKEFHIGHLMSNAIGESISRIIEFSGAKVKRANYQGDVGLHVAKAIFGKQKNPDMEWGRAYAYGAQAYEKDGQNRLRQGYGEAREEIKEINKKIYDKSDEKINSLYEKGKKTSLEHFEEIYRKLGTKFDYYFFESKTGSFGKKIVADNLGKVFEKSDGAIIFKGEKYGLHTRVFVNSEGLPTYEAKDLGLAKIKYDEYKYDKSIVVTGNEVKEYYKVVLETIKQIFPDLAKKTKHITHGMLRLQSGKMSSRRGNVITGESLINEVKEKVLEKMKDSDVKNIDDTAEQIAVGAIKYSILKQSAGKDIVFDFEKSLSFEGDSGPYLQYSHTRANAVLEKAKSENITSNTFKVESWAVTELERLLYIFPEVVERANEKYDPHYITTYLTELAGAFNSFYAKERIVEESETAQYKIALTKAFQTTIKNGLWLLGIKAPNRM